MGIARSTVEQKRTYLTKIAQDIHSLASQGLRGQYDGMLGNVMKLRMNVREANDMFALEMKTTGHSVPFVDQTVGGRRPLHATHSKNDNSTTSAPIQQSSSYDGLLTSVDPRNVGSFYPAICQGTMGVPFETTRTMEHGGPFMTQSITFMDVYRKYSFEELRLSDYNIQATIQSSKTPLTPSKTEFRGFGAPPTKPSGSPLSKGSEAPPKDQIPLFGQILPFQSKEKSMPEIYQWIQDEIKTSRGTELQGTLNPDVLPVLFHKQINNWRAISKRHFFNVRNITSDAMMKMLHAICIDSLTRTKVDGLISECNKKSHSRGLTELLDRIDTISSSHLQTNNPAFEQKVSKARRTRFQAALERYRSSKGSPPSFSGFGSDKGSSLTGNELVIDMRDTSSLFAELHMSNSQNLEDEVHDTLKAYYEIARDNFVEYVNQLIVEPYLSDSRGPVLFFSPTYLAGLSDKTIEDLGAEDGNLVEKRTSKADELARLDRAKEIAEGYST